jgi:hypothetical protein
MKKKTKNNSEEKSQNVAEECTLLLARSGVSAMDALAIVLNMLRYHSSLVMDEASHDAFMKQFQALFQRTMLKRISEGSDSFTHADAWIIEHAEELKSQLLELAKAGAPRPAPGTVLGRALEMFTTKPVVDEMEQLTGKKQMTKREADWYAIFEEMKRIGIKNITPGHHLYRWMLRQRQAYRRFNDEHPEHK